MWNTATHRLLGHSSTSSTGWHQGVSGAPSSVAGMTTRTERLDGLPFTRKHRKLLLGSGVGLSLIHI